MGIRTDPLFLEILRFYDFQDGGVTHLGFSKFQIFSSQSGKEG